METEDGPVERLTKVKDCRDLVYRLWLRLPAVDLGGIYDALTRCLGFPIVATSSSSNNTGARNAGSDQRFDFDPYTAAHTDEFDHLLSQDPTSRSFLSRLPFTRTRTPRRQQGGVGGGLLQQRKSNRRGSRSSTDESSSLTSLLIDTSDADLIGDESINMLLTSTGPSSNTSAATPSTSLPGFSDARALEQTDEELRAEEEAIMAQEEAAIEERRKRAGLLARERGILPHQRPS